MAAEDPSTFDYLGVVSEWQSFGAHGGARLGNAYPLINLKTESVVEEPEELFPNPGYVFLLSRGELSAWDYVSLRPQTNPRYQNSSEREAYYVCHSTPPVYTGERLAVALTVPAFNPVDRVIRNPTQAPTPVFFVYEEMSGKFFGPLRNAQPHSGSDEDLGAVRWKPYNADSSIFEAFESELTSAGLKCLTYNASRPEMNEVVRSPFTFLAGDFSKLRLPSSHDVLPDTDLFDWYAQYRPLPTSETRSALDGMRENVRLLLQSAEQHVADRARRLLKLVQASETMEREHGLLINQFLASETGKIRLNEAITAEVTRRSQQVDDEVEKQQSRLADEKSKVDRQLRELAEFVERKEEQLKEHIAQLEQREQLLQGSVQALNAQLESGVEKIVEVVNQSVPVVAALSANRSEPPTTTEETRPCWSEVGFVEPSKPLTELSSETHLIQLLHDDLVARGLSFTQTFIKNIYVSLKSFQLNLISGPPGHGKSTLVRGIAEAFGHSRSLLEVPVRRTWSDDRYLLGFYDAFHKRFDPGHTGLVPHLLRAQRDWDNDGDSISVVLLDEFNLAAPEYYFSQLLQLLPREESSKRLQLYKAAGESEVDAVSIHPNVRFFGTINYDETTERLSPRVLDRTGLIFLSPDDASPSLASEDRDVSRPAEGVKASQFVGFCRTAAECPDEAWEELAPSIEILCNKHEDLGLPMTVSPRLRNSIRTYLANATGVLAHKTAADFAFQQRILPTLSGSGEGFRSRVEKLHEALESSGLRRSASHVGQALARAESSFGDVDFLDY